MARHLPHPPAAFAFLWLLSCRGGPPPERRSARGLRRSGLAQSPRRSGRPRHGCRHRPPRERLEILERRRRFAKVRTAEETGLDGWPYAPPARRQMARLRKVAARAARLPSQGKASPFDLLNVHTDPNRQSPSFYQVGEDEVVDVIGGMPAPRVHMSPGRRRLRPSHGLGRYRHRRLESCAPQGRPRRMGAGAHAAHVHPRRGCAIRRRMAHRPTSPSDR
jgi:hypothetical protein